MGFYPLSYFGAVEYCNIYNRIHFAIIKFIKYSFKKKVSCW